MYVCLSIKKSEIMKEMNRSGVATKREKSVSLVTEEAPLDAGIVVVVGW